MEKEADRILRMFESNNVKYQLYEHEPVHTSQEAAKVRGVELKTGCKSMVLETKKGNFILTNIAADRKIDLRKLEKTVGSKLNFATREEVLQATNCESGSVPPFGNLFGLTTYLDKSVLENDFVNFNIGLLTKSARICREDLLKLMNPIISEFSKTDLSKNSGT